MDPSDRAELLAAYHRLVPEAEREQMAVDGAFIGIVTQDGIDEDAVRREVGKARRWNRHDVDA